MSRSHKAGTHSMLLTHMLHTTHTGRQGARSHMFARYKHKAMGKGKEVWKHTWRARQDTHRQGRAGRPQAHKREELLCLRRHRSQNLSQGTRCTMV